MSTGEDDDPDMLAEYDFSSGVRGKYFDWVAGHCQLVRLEPDVAAVLTDSESVNEALHGLIPVIKKHLKKLESH